MDSAVSYRAVEESDLSFLKSVYISTRVDELSATDWSQQQIEAFLSMQFEAQHRFYQEQFPSATFEIIQVNHIDAGRLYLDYREDEIRIVDIALLPQFRTSGLGTGILKTIIRNAEEKSLCVRIHVEKNNPALSLYQRLGFKQIGDKGVYWLTEKRTSKQAA